jgi:hypothetical protein
LVFFVANSILEQEILNTHPLLNVCSLPSSCYVYQHQLREAQKGVEGSMLRVTGSQLLCDGVDFIIKVRVCLDIVGLAHLAAELGTQKLTRIQGAFAKRDLFVANSDLARGMIVVSIFALAPLDRITRDLHLSVAYHVGFLFCGVVLLFLVGGIFWVRMTRFRVLSETPVFHAYLASVPEVKTAATAAK